MKTFFLFIALAVTSNGMAQGVKLQFPDFPSWMPPVFCKYCWPYTDFPGGVIRTTELVTANLAKGTSNKVRKTFILSNATTGAEKSSRTRLNINRYTSAHINYLDYKNMCNVYINPFKKKKCNDRYRYLITAHEKVLDLLDVRTANQINKGVKEQIGEKYTSITNTILKELEQMKNKAKKNMMYKLLTTH